MEQRRQPPGTHMHTTTTADLTTPLILPPPLCILSLLIILPPPRTSPCSESNSHTAPSTILLNISHYIRHPTDTLNIYTTTFQQLQNNGILHPLDDDDNQYVLMLLHRLLLPEIKNFVGRKEGWRVAMYFIELRLFCDGMGRMVVVVVGMWMGGFHLDQWCRCYWRFFCLLYLRLSGIC